VLVLLLPSLALSLSLASSPGIRLVCSDVDGTLLTPAHEVTERTVATVFRAMDIVPFFACTGRGRSGAYHALGAIGDRLRRESAGGVFLNGLVAYAPGGELILDTRLPPAVVLDVADFAAEHSAALTAFSGDRVLTAERDEWTDLLVTYRDPTPEVVGSWPFIAAEEPVNKLIILADRSRVAALRPLLAARLGSSATITQAVPEMLEVLPAGGSKGVGVAALLKHIGMPAELVLAMGDAENDLGMLELAGVSVAMGNAADEVKRVAQHVTAANDADGAALALEHHLLTARDRHAKGAEQEQEIVGSAPN